jgi:Ca-activated chloride channel homolog
MEFLNPTALYGLLALPLLLLPYLIRKRPQRVVFSSLLLFADLAANASGRPWGKLRLPPIFFLQLLLLTLLILALGEPVFSVHPTKIAIVLDNSASMQTMEGGKSRFTLAKEKAHGFLTDVGATGKTDLYLTVPGLERIGGTALDFTEAAGLLASIEPYDLPDAPLDYDKLLGQMAREQKYERIYFITDHPVRSQSGAIRGVTVGNPTENLALTSFQVSRSSLVNARSRAVAEVANFSPKNEKVKVLLRGSGTMLASRDLVVPPGKSVQASFEGFPLHSYYEAEIDARDALPLDNRRFALSPKSQELRILGISPLPQALASLRSIPGVALDIVAPDDYFKTDRSGYNFEIFHFCFPAALPQNPALFVLPPANNSLADLEKSISRPIVSSWREPHPLTRYVNFTLFRPSYARPLKPKVVGESIIETPSGPLAFSVERDATRYLVLGFDPFPFLGRANLPISVFTLNFLDWLFETAGKLGKTTGEPLALSNIQAGDWMITPRGDKISLKPGARAFPSTFIQGIYQLSRGGVKEQFAVNLEDASESDLRAPSSIEIHGENTGRTSASALFSFWPYLLLASVLLLLVEWFIRPRAPRLSSRPRSGRVLARL